jgi:serine protease Do
MIIQYFKDKREVNMKSKILIPAVLLALLMGLSGCTPTTTTSPIGGTTTSSTSTITTAPVTPTLSPTQATTPTLPVTKVTDLEAILESVYTQVNPSVVNISVIALQTGSSQIPNLPFFNQTPQYSQALGSGFVWDKAGDIVTNNHVIDGADNISVTFSDGTTVPGKVVGTDSDSDLAVVKVDMPADQLLPVSMADSTQVKVGQIAIAIGNPYGLQSTMTVGFVSALGRVLPSNSNQSSTTTGPSYSIPDVIQTDAAINPGNSGGVLLDSSGSVIGITQSIATTSGSSSGVGFAIPSAIIKQVIPDLISSGHYSHPYFGVTITSLTPDISAAMNLPANQRGALVMAVTAGGPAEKAGLKAGNKQVTITGQPVTVGGDVITAFNNQTVKSSDDIITFLARSGNIGENVSLTVLRDGNPIQITVTVGARPAQ